MGKGMISWDPASTTNATRHIRQTCNTPQYRFRIDASISKTSVPKKAIGDSCRNTAERFREQSFKMSENYGQYQVEIYGKGALMNILPSVTTDPRLLEEQARKALGSRAFNYVAGGAGEKATMDSNRLAFRQWKLYVASPSNLGRSEMNSIQFLARGRC